MDSFRRQLAISVASFSVLFVCYVLWKEGRKYAADRCSLMKPGLAFDGFHDQGCQIFLGT
jgi:hypothetical protein